jgi:hypothetical protein
VKFDVDINRDVSASLTNRRNYREIEHPQGTGRRPSGDAQAGVDSSNKTCTICLERKNLGKYSKASRISKEEVLSMRPDGKLENFAGNAPRRCQTKGQACDAAGLSQLSDSPSSKGGPVSGRARAEHTGEVPRLMAPDAGQPAKGNDEGFWQTYKHCHLSPMDQRQLEASRSEQELKAKIRVIAKERHCCYRTVERQARQLSVWEKLVASPRRQLTIKQRNEVERLLSRSPSTATKADRLEVVASLLETDRAAARRLIYRDPVLVECLLADSYSLRQVAETLCMGRNTIRRHIEGERLHAKRLQVSGKLYITSKSIFDFARNYPWEINWRRCLSKSLFLNDVLESQRIKELADLLCVAEKSIRCWMDKGFLYLPFNPDHITDLFADEPIFRFLDEHPDKVDLIKCSAKHPEWFAKYAQVRGHYPVKERSVDSKAKSTAAAEDNRYYLALK